MLLGRKYEKNAPFELFLRTMETGTFSLKEIRKKYIFIPTNQFVDIISKCVNRKIIIIDKKEKKVSFSKKVKMVIDFIEKTDFINQLSNYKDTGTTSSLVHKYLIKTKFFDRHNNDNSFLDVEDELNKCLRLIYNQSFTNEIVSLDLII